MNGCNAKIPDKGYDDCHLDFGKESDITIHQPNPRELKVTKVIYNYKAKTEKQIKDSIQLEIDTFLTDRPSYEFVNSNSRFNKTGGIELQLNFELNFELI